MNNMTAYKAALDLVDALWTYEVRAKAIAGNAPLNEMVPHFLELDQLVRRACAALEGKKVTASRKEYWTGTGNVVKKNHELVRSYIPQWDLITDEGEQEWQRAASGADSTNADASIQILL